MIPTIQPAVSDHPAVEWTEVVDEQISFGHDLEPVLKINVVDLDAVTTIARIVHQWADPATYRCYNVDFSQEFRYCLETGLNPVPERELEYLELSVPESELASDTITECTIDDHVSGSGRAVLETIRAQLERTDPDVLMLNTSDVVPVLYQQAERCDMEFELGRLGLFL
ncbi:hypothetical protein DMJ13_18070 [halophilic archaeon]|nr:hypothetical protein DMJ13_18070 [halophilic archaeon]